MYVRRKRSAINTRARRTYKHRSVQRPKRVVSLRKRPGYGRSIIPISPRWTNPLAQSKTFKLRYADTRFDMSTAVGSGYISKNVFRGNSLFDPDYTGVGVQPYGFDQLTAIYGSYMVYASRIKVSLYVTEQTYKGKLTVVPSTDNALDYTDENDLKMSPYAKQHWIDYLAGMRRRNTIVSYCSTRRMFPEVNTKDATYRALVSANPEQEWYWHVYFDTLDVANETSAYADVEITYYCRMTRIQNSNES